MGLTATGYKIHGDKVTLDSVYINVRDLSTNKETLINTEYVFSFSCYVLLDNIRVDIIRINSKQTEPFVENLWEKAYTLLKDKLTEKSISFSDSI